MVNIVQSAADVQFLKTVDKSARTEDGEILEFRPDCPFRSVTDLKAFDDAEKKKGVSMTDPSQYEPLESIIARCRRGELYFDPNKGWYGVDSKTDIDKVLDEFEDPIDDLTNIDDMAEKLAEELNETPDAVAPAEQQGAASPAPEKVEQEA